MTWRKPRGPPMHDLRHLYGQLLELNGRAFADQRFEVAYNTLAAALHCADELRASGLLSEVRRLADEQGMWLDQHAPDHPLAARSALRRGNLPILAALAKQAESMLLRLERDRQANKLRRTGHAGDRPADGDRTKN